MRDRIAGRSHAVLIGVMVGSAEPQASHSKRHHFIVDGGALTSDAPVLARRLRNASVSHSARSGSPIATDAIGMGGLANPNQRQIEDALEMRLDVNEDDKGYRVTVDVPGVKKENIDVSIEGNKISISVEVKREEKREKEKELYSERYSGKAFRAFTLPSEIDSAKAEARYDGGVLTLTLPKKADSSSRKVSVN